ncbi:hypothetical protein K469DRAFT_712027 [Zopfia rhizophila CBS 207.26]|uniref:Uncharacterized protein n=1 Tax=Zopfia rhizophila CBS 207.26 TaxID=1314779 RepID=A0A6A6DS71_9PEZI|nr:hypothetical protein K469DRAFT_712027 [Zopfia rhizophila CBS 207.26]
MKFLLALAALVPLIVAYLPDPYPAPCGRSTPSGRCTTKEKCYKLGGFYVQRDCTFCFRLPN